MSTDFVHLHVHTDYSMLDGTCRISDLADQAAAFEMKAVACTDHGNMCGSFDFYQKMTAKGIKPILGCEFYVAPTSCRERDPQQRHNQGFHLVCLAESNVGYRNLCQLNAKAWLEGYYYKPRVDKELLAQHSEGLIALTACLGGEVPAYILDGDDKRAQQALQDYLDIFGRGNLYVELQDHGLEEQKRVNARLIEYSKTCRLPLVVTNDSHYLRREHAQAHDLFLCIGTQSTVDATDRFRFHGADFYFKSGEEMAALFPDYPETVTNTVAIAERCNVTLKTVSDGANHYPEFSVPETTTRQDYLRQICLEGLQERYGFDPAAPQLDADQRAKIDRLDFELGVINQTGFTSYFLVVWDFLHYARSQGIPVGPGRGSGAGSLVAYLTQITDIDPIRYGLLFERFLNPERVSPPDFDIDLCERRRYEVIDYVRRKYGNENVVQIGTFGTLKAKAVIKDVARALGRSFDEGNRITKLVPNDPKMTLEKALDESAELKEMVDGEPWVQEVIQYGRILEGLNRNMSIHAAGVIIGDEPVANVVPIAKGAGDEPITQFSAGPCEELGLLKMDFLGLRTLTIIQDALDLISRNRGIQMRSSEIPLEDRKTFDLLNSGNTIAVFQLESSGMRDLCRRFGVNRLEDIIALIALYRPGPMQFLDEFIDRKTGRTPVEYDVPEMEALLSETYGIMLYQEQVMQVVQTVAGFSLGQADILRRAMGKKKVEVMEAMFPKFVEGCSGRDIDADTAKRIWDKIYTFAGYGFNKSHSAAYAMLSYQTAFLKANYPTEFMAAVLTSELGNAEKLAFFLKECRGMGIDVRPPDINICDLRFSVDGDAIRFGLAAIKGVGSAAVEGILRARDKEGPFKDMLDFCERVTDGLGRRVLENLIKAGACDCFGLRRSQLFAMIDEALSRAQQSLQDKRMGQGSLFDFMAPEEVNPLKLSPPDMPEWDTRELLSYEKELLGFYVSGHPIAEFAEMLKTYQIDDISEVFNLDDGCGTRTGGLITAVDVKRAKKDNRPWAIVTLEGMEAGIECMVFADSYAECNALLQPERTVFVEGALSRRDEETPKLLVEKVFTADEAPERFASEVHVRINETAANKDLLQRIRDLCDAHRGDTTLLLCLICQSGEIAFVQPANLKISNNAAFRQAVLDLLGPGALREKADRTRPKGRERRRQRFAETSNGENS